MRALGDNGLHAAACPATLVHLLTAGGGRDAILLAPAVGFDAARRTEGRVGVRVGAWSADVPVETARGAADVLEKGETPSTPPWARAVRLWLVHCCVVAEARSRSVEPRR